MKSGRRDFDDQPDNSEEPVSIIIDVSPELWRKIRTAAAEKEQSVYEYLNTILEQAVAGKTIETQTLEHPVTNKTLELLDEISEEIMRDRQGRLFEESIAEMLEKARIERTRELMGEEGIPMEFIVHPEIFERFPGIHLPVVIVQGIHNEVERPEVEERWQAAWKEAAKATSYGNAQSHPAVQPWRERFKAMGVSGKQFPSSIESLLRRALKGDDPFFINPLVDFYNTISLQYVVPAGGFDLYELYGPIELRLTRPGDTFMALDEDSAQEVPPGEVAYANGNNILTRHFVWRQAKTGLITASTSSVFLVAEVLGELGRDVAENVLAALQNGLERYFNIKTHGFLVHAGNPRIEWE